MQLLILIAIGFVLTSCWRDPSTCTKRQPELHRVLSLPFASDSARPEVMVYVNDEPLGDYGVGILEDDVFRSLIEKILPPSSTVQLPSIYDVILYTTTDLRVDSIVMREHIVGCTINILDASLTHMWAKTYIAHPASTQLGHVDDLDCAIDGWITNCWSDMAEKVIPRYGHAKPSSLRFISNARLPELKREYARVRRALHGGCNEFMARIQWVGSRKDVATLCR